MSSSLLKEIFLFTRHTRSRVFASLLCHSVIFFGFFYWDCFFFLAQIAASSEPTTKRKISLLFLWPDKKQDDIQATKIWGQKQQRQQQQQQQQQRALVPITADAIDGKHKCCCCCCVDSIEILELLLLLLLATANELRACCPWLLPACLAPPRPSRNLMPT